MEEDMNAEAGTDMVTAVRGQLMHRAFERNAARADT